MVVDATVGIAGIVEKMHRSVRGDVRLVGQGIDLGLVPLDSALGRHPGPGHTLRFPDDRQRIGYGVEHFELPGRPEVYSQLQAWMKDETQGTAVSGRRR